MTKELFNTVTSNNVTNIIVNGNYIMPEIAGAHNVSSVNIYEFAYRCKEWAKQMGVTYFTSSIGDDEGLAEFYIGFTIYQFEGKNEIDAIFKACQWILKNKETI